ncbi:MAG: PadR family transcriptional regulator [Desulfobacteraceae bacterium]|nr:MAG: PadR family transcriptional regulator [Desulfobacteraceae bacterium]
MIRYAILGLLHYKDMHGYRIKEHIEQNFGHMWSINYGQIYPNLKKLYEDGLISMTEMNQNGQKGPTRKLYAITVKGKEEFSRWLEESPEKPMLLRDPFLMRFVFYGFGDKNRFVEIIDNQINRYENDLKRRRKNLKRWDKNSIYVRLIAELGTSLNEMFITWLKHSKEEILKDERENTERGIKTGKRRIA